MTQLASQPPTRRSLRDASPADGGGPDGTQTPAPGSVHGSSRYVSHSAHHLRGRHATSSGQGFGYLIGWTLAGAVLPGSGLIAAGRRVAGWLLVSLTIGSVLGVLFYVVARGGPMKAAMTMRDVVLEPARLTQLAVFAAVGGLAWCFVVLFSHLALRRYAVPTRSQNLLSVGLVTALILGIAAPAAQASNLALIQRDLLKSLFDSQATGKPKTAAPQVQKKDPWATVPRVNVLLLGSDAGADRTGLRPDTIILASINTRTGDTVMFSLPRSLQRAPFPEGSEGAKAWPNGFGPVGSGPGNEVCGPDAQLCLINAVWRAAEGEARSYFPGDKDPGLTATEQAVEGVLGLKVDYYIMLNLKGFQDFINAIHGVTINVSERLPMGGNSEHKVATEGYIEKGRQHMNGYHALWYARSRWSTNDYDRMRRQRCVIGAVAEQTDPLTVMQNFRGIAKALKNNLQTDIPLKQLPAFGDLAMRIKDSKVRSLPFTRDVIDTVHPDWEHIRSLVQESLKPPKPKSTTSTSPGTTDPTPGTSGGTGTSTTTKKPTKAGQTTKAADPTQAQDVQAVC